MAVRVQSYFRFTGDDAKAIAEAIRESRSSGTGARAFRDAKTRRELRLKNDALTYKTPPAK